MQLSRILGLAIAIGAGAPVAVAQHQHTLTLDMARHAAATVARLAHDHGVGGAVAVVDAGGNLVTLDRPVTTFAAAAPVSIGKAKTAALFGKPTSAFEKVINDGRTAMAALPSLPDFTPLQGGVPIVVDGTMIGAIGVSGAKSALQDEEFAVAAAAAVAASCCTAGAANAAVTHFAADTVEAAFAKGMPLLEVEHFKIHASRRDQPGRAEVHDDETDVIYVLAGSATFVTGGTVVGGAITQPHETRGDSIAGGDTRVIGKGDVVVVPAGTPHWFKAVQGPLLYYVVKVIG